MSLNYAHCLMFLKLILHESAEELLLGKKEPMTDFFLRDTEKNKKHPVGFVFCFFFSLLLIFFRVDNYYI